MHRLLLIIGLIVHQSTMAADPVRYQGTYDGSFECQPSDACPSYGLSVDIVVDGANLCGGVAESAQKSYMHFFSAAWDGKRFRGFYLEDVTRPSEHGLEIQPLVVERVDDSVELQTFRFLGKGMGYRRIHSARLTDANRPTLKDYATDAFSVEDFCSAILSHSSVREAGQ